MRNRTSIITSLVLAVALVFGGYQAVEARGVLRQAADCPAEGNWCATSRGGLNNCNQCCGTEVEQTSFCAFFDEDPSSPPLPQGCVCG